MLAGGLQEVRDLKDVAGDLKVAVHVHGAVVPRQECWGVADQGWSAGCNGRAATAVGGPGGKPERWKKGARQQLGQQQQQRAWTARRNPRAWVAEGAEIAGMPPKWREGHPTVNSMPDLGAMFHLIRLLCREKGLCTG
ncbi:hypothetical protein GCM10017752_42580 [Streptomyces roseoviridis]